MISVVVLSTILAYGFLKIWFCRIYSSIVARVVLFFGYDPSSLLQKLNAFSTAEKYQDHYLGWFIYYPTYLLLHLAFVFFLFRPNKQMRNKVWFGLLLVVFGLIFIIIFSKLFHISLLFEISYGLFRHLFGLPFILLVIEGGRLILQDIDKLLKHDQKKFN